MKKTFSLLLPIVYALKALAEFATPIYHRDIKPQNILVDDSAEELRLVLADFGCAYMEESDKRITDDFRAVGAQLYRAPEYQYGRVEDVDEKGDIFSIGKLIWNMINGNKAEVFPYTLWFPKEYNLSVRFPNTVELRRANNLIAACVNYDKSKRPTYQQLIEEMEDILSSNNSKDDKSEMIQKAREFEARRVLVNAGNCEKAVFLLASYLSDFRGALCNFTDFKLEFVRKMESRHYALPTEVQMDVLQALVERNTEFKLLSMELQGVYYQTSYRPSTDATALLNIPGVVRELPCLYTFYGGGHVKRSDMSIFFINGILHYKNEAGKIEKYTGKVWTEYLEEFIRRYVQ